MKNETEILITGTDDDEAPYEAVEFAEGENVVVDNVNDMSPEEPAWLVGLYDNDPAPSDDDDPTDYAE